MNLDHIESAILNAIAFNINRLPNVADADYKGNARPANGVTMLIDVAQLDYHEVLLVVPRIKQRADLFIAIGILGYKDIYLVGKDSYHVTTLWSNAENN